MVRAFSDADITHVEGEVDPVRDLDIISNELRQKDLAKATELATSVRKLAERGDKAKKQQLEVYEKIEAHLKAGKDIRYGTWSTSEIEVLNELLLLTAKPVIYLVNLSERDYKRKKNKWLGKIKQWIDEHESNPIIIPYSADYELQLALMPDEESRAKAIEEAGVPRCVCVCVCARVCVRACVCVCTFSNEHGGSSACFGPRRCCCCGVVCVCCCSMLSKIVKTGYQALHLEYFFTAGPVGFHLHLPAAFLRMWMLSRHAHTHTHTHTHTRARVYADAHFPCCFFSLHPQDEVRAWTIQKGTKAPQAAGKIHTDFEKGFIMAEVMNFADFKEHGSEAAVKVHAAFLLFKSQKQQQREKGTVVCEGVG